jgi:hypothetical protein
MNPVEYRRRLLDGILEGAAIGILALLVGGLIFVLAFGMPARASAATLYEQPVSTISTFGSTYSSDGTLAEEIYFTTSGNLSQLAWAPDTSNSSHPDCNNWVGGPMEIDLFDYSTGSASYAHGQAAFIVRSQYPDSNGYCYADAYTGSGFMTSVTAGVPYIIRMYGTFYQVPYNYLGSPTLGAHSGGMGSLSGATFTSDSPQGGVQSLALAITDTTGTYYPPVTDIGIRPQSPLEGAVTGGTTVTLSANYSLPIDGDVLGIGHVESIALYLNRTDATQSLGFTFSPVNYGGSSNVSTTTTLAANSNWKASWCFSNADGSGIALCKDVNFSVESDPISGLIGATSTDNLQSLATSTCSVLNVAGCFQNALVFLFWPNSSVTAQFQTLQGSIRSRAPFGYVYIIKDAISGVNASSTPAFSLDIPDNIESGFFAPLRTGIAAILWILVAFWFFKRIRDLHL